MASVEYVQWSLADHVSQHIIQYADTGQVNTTDRRRRQGGGGHWRATMHFTTRLGELSSARLQKSVKDSPEIQRSPVRPGSVCK